MKELVEKIAKALVDNPDQVQVRAIERPRNSNRRTARAIRTILSAAGMKLRKRFT